jgi:hypothetical protein
LIPAVLCSVAVIALKPLIIMLIMRQLGYQKRTSFLAALPMAQISEFSLILAALGVTLGHLTSEHLALITLVGLLTFAASTYLISYSHPLYTLSLPVLGVIERRSSVSLRPADEPSHMSGADALVVGLGRFGGCIADGLASRGLRVTGIDFDPAAVLHWRRQGRSAEYGDADDPELPERDGIRHATWLVCSVPVLETNLAVLRSFRAAGFTGRIALTAHNQHDADRCRRAGADLVLLPFRDAAVQAVDEMLGEPDRADSRGSMQR